MVIEVTVTGMTISYTPQGRKACEMDGRGLPHYRAAIKTAHGHPAYSNSSVSAVWDVGSKAGSLTGGAGRRSGGRGTLSRPAGGGREGCQTSPLPSRGSTQSGPPPGRWRAHARCRAPLPGGGERGREGRKTEMESREGRGTGTRGESRRERERGTEGGRVNEGRGNFPAGEVREGVREGGKE